jgi:hypothetical protein
MSVVFLVFWVIMIIWALTGFMWNWPGASSPTYAPMGGSLMLFILLALLGWKVFGVG